MERLDILIEQNERLYNFLKTALSCRYTCGQRNHIMPIEEHKVVDKRNELEQYTEDELMTIDMARVEMKVSRGTVYNLIRDGKLKKLTKNSRNVRLIKAEVMAAKIWYSATKGKI